VLVTLQGQLSQQFVTVLLSVLYQQTHIVFALLTTVLALTTVTPALQLSSKLELVHVV
jgi:hypothetical protein